MGYDVYGRHPKSPEGEYFRASVWSWPPILSLIRATGTLPAELVDRMAFNDGTGPEDDESATRLADAIESILEREFPDAPAIAFLDEPRGTSSMAVDVLATLIGEGFEVQPDRGPLFYVDREQVEEFVRFCRASGGFEVW